MPPSPFAGESIGAGGGLNPPANTEKNQPRTVGVRDPRLHKPGVAGSSPAAATLRFDETIDDYHSDAEWWSKSQLWGLRSNGPLWFHERYIAHSIQSPQTESLRKGTLVHEWCEQGDRAWWGRVVLVPAEFVGANGAILKRGEDWLASQPKDAIVLRSSEAKAYEAQFAQIKANPIWRKLNEATEHREFSIRWTCPESGLQVRCRPDAATETVLWDLKTTKDQQPLKTFHKSVHDYGYGFQAALYTRLARAAEFRAEQFVFVVSSTVPPYECHAVVLPREYLAQCERHVTETCSDLAARLALDHWLDDNAGQLTELYMPYWTMEGNSSNETGFNARRRE